MPSPGCVDDDALRRGYAARMLALAGVGRNPALEDAFATVRREEFLGGAAAVDPAAIYRDAVIPLDPARGINNGSPALHALWLDALAPGPGETVAHLGAGTGYYTAILARLVGPAGRVIAVEIEPGLAARARNNLARYGNVTVIAGSAAGFPDAPADCIYVNFGVERVRARWIDRLAEGGRLVFPLGYRRHFPNDGITGGGFRVERRGEAFAARFLGVAYFIGDAEAPEESDAWRARLRAAFADERMLRGIRSFRWNRAASPGDCLRVDGCWLADDGRAFRFDTV